MKKFVTAVVLLTLSACSSDHKSGLDRNMLASGWDRDLNEGLDRFLGHPVYHLLDRLDPRIEDRWVANEKLYVLATRQTAPDEPMLSGASKASDAPTIDEDAVSHKWGCYIRIFADANGTTERYDWRGNGVDCRSFVEQLKKWPAQY